MKLSEVSDSDLKMIGQLINMLQNGTYDLNGKDLCASADTIRWFQTFGVDAAKVYKESKASEKASQVVGSPAVSSNAPSSPLGEGVSIKSFGKAKK